MWFNPIMKLLIASPLHFFVSKQIMLITYTGRKSGKTFTTPVNYINNGDRYYTTSLRSRTWWRNLRNGSPVQLLVERKKITAIPSVIEHHEQVVSKLQTYFQLTPKIARYYKITLDENDIPLGEDLNRVAETTVLVEFNTDEQISL